MVRQGGSGGVGRHHHQNTYAFKHNKYSKLTAKIQNIVECNLCSRCNEIIEWRKKYRKYKPLTDAAKCVYCKQRNITHAYYKSCGSCCQINQCCTKCLQPICSVGELLPSNHDNITVDELQNRINNSIITQRYKYRLKKLYNDNKCSIDECIDKLEQLEQRQLNKVNHENNTNTGVNRNETDSDEFSDDVSDTDDSSDHTASHNSIETSSIRHEANQTIQQLTMLKLHNITTNNESTQHDTDDDASV